MTSADRRQTPYVIAVFNQKGGISKTTTATNLAVCLKAFGANVVVVDLDAQGDSTKHLCEGSPSHPGIFELFMGEKTLTESLVPTRFEDIAIVPSSYDLAGIEIQLNNRLSSQDHWQGILARAIESAALDVDYIVIDCPPGLGFLPVNALVAAHAVLIPVTASPLAYDGLMRTLPIVQHIQGRFNKALKVHGILLTLVGTDMVGRKTVARLKENFASDMYEIEVPLDDAVVEASGHRLPVVVFEPRARASAAYLSLTAEFLQRQAMLERRARGLIEPARDSMAALKAEAFLSLSALQQTHGQVVRDRQAFFANRRALKSRLGGNRSFGERLHFWLVNAAIYYKGWFFFALFLAFGGAAALLTAVIIMAAGHNM